MKSASRSFHCTDSDNGVRVCQCFPTFSMSRYPCSRCSYLTVPLEENTYFFKLIYFLIVSYVRDKVVYCSCVSIYALVNYVISFIFLFLHLAIPQVTAEPRLGITGVCICGGGNCRAVVETE
jgi:hypothetical protein